MYKNLQYLFDSFYIQNKTLREGLFLPESIAVKSSALFLALLEVNISKFCYFDNWLFWQWDEKVLIE